MAKTLLSSSPCFHVAPLPRLPHHARLTFPLYGPRRRPDTRVKLSFQEIPPLHNLDSVVDFHGIISRAEGILYTLADAAVVAEPSSAGAAATDTAVQKNGGWFGFISDAMEIVLKVLKDGLTTVHIPYAYGFAIILLTVIVKAATLPLTKKQVESTLAMQNLQPKIKAIQERYKGNQEYIWKSAVTQDFLLSIVVRGVECKSGEVGKGINQFPVTTRARIPERIQLETGRLYKQAGVNPLAGCLPTLATIPVWIGLYQALSNVANEGLLTEGFFWIPSLGGPTTIAARQSGAGISWLIPFVSIASRLPSLIARIGCCIILLDGHPPLGWYDTAAYLVLPVLLVLSQYVSMEIMKPPQSDDPSAKNSLLVLKFLPLMIGYFSLSVPSGLSIYWFTNNILSTAQQLWLRKMGGAKPVVSEDAGGIITAGRAKRSTSQSERTGERFKQLKEEENKKATKALPSEGAEMTSSTPTSEDDSDEETGDQEKVREEAYASSANKQLPDYTGPKRGKRSKRKRTVQ